MRFHVEIILVRHHDCDLSVVSAVFVHATRSRKPTRVALGGCDDCAGPAAWAEEYCPKALFLFVCMHLRLSQSPEMGWEEGDK